MFADVVATDDGRAAGIAIDDGGGGGGGGGAAAIISQSIDQGIDEKDICCFFELFTLLARREPFSLFFRQSLG